MKKQIFIILIGLLSVLNGANAQRKQATESYETKTDLPMYGTITYNYIIDDNGKHIKDGPFSINANLKKVQAYYGYQKYTGSGNYTLTTNFNKGKINGAIKLNSTTVVTCNGKSQNYKLAFTGNFKNGIPNGNFSINYTAAPYSKVNVNFNNGNLVGSYYIDNVYDKYRLIKGTLTADGKLNGKWEIDNGYGTEEYIFQNGILISISSKGTSTPPKISEISKKFADGNLSEQELYELKYQIKEDSLSLGDYVTDIILREDGIDFYKLGGYNFKYNNNKKYKYIKPIYYLTDEGFTKILNIIKYCLVKKSVNNDYIKIDYGNQDNTKYHGLIRTDENGQEYIELYYFELVKDAYSQSDILNEKIYLTEEQSKIIEDETEKAYREHAYNLSQYYNKYWNLDITKIFEKDSISQVAKASEINLIYKRLTNCDINELPTTDDKLFLIHKDSENYTSYIKASAIDELNSYISTIQNFYKNSAYDIYGYFNAINKNYISENLKHINEISDITKIIETYDALRNCPIDTFKTTEDGNFIIGQFNEEYTPYIKKSVIDELQTFKKQILDIINQYYQNQYEGRLNIIFNENTTSQLKDILKISPVLNFLINKSSISIAYDENSSDYFIPNDRETIPNTSINREYWKLEISDRIKKFTKITNIDIIEFDNTNNSVTINITQKKKKIYQTELFFYYGKIITTSIDKSKAKLISEK